MRSTDRGRASAGNWTLLYGAGAAFLATLVLTSVHHLYGARQFETPWRAHVAHVAVWTAVVATVCVLVARFRARRTSGRIALIAFVTLSVAVCVLWLGLYEGGYNHALKNLVYAAHPPASIFSALFPPSLYEPPGDWLFELSGVLQLPLGLVAGLAAWRAYRAPPRA